MIKTIKTLVVTGASTGLVLYIYAVTFWFIWRAHTEVGIAPNSQVTSYYCYMQDTPGNRALMGFFAPMRLLPMFQAPVYWHE